MIVARLAALGIGYLLGAFQTGYFYGKFHGIDIREHGSGNSGTTNTLRTLGWKAGLITFSGDVVKVFLAIGLTWLLFHGSYEGAIRLLAAYAGFGTVLGHNFPFYMHFKGGKGIACTAAVLAVVCPLSIPLCAIGFGLVVGLTRYVSAGSILMLVLFAVQAIVFNHFGVTTLESTYALEYDIVVTCFAIMGIWRHRANIKRLMNGTENKFGQKAK